MLLRNSVQNQKCQLKVDAFEIAAWQYYQLVEKVADITKTTNETPVLTRV